MPTLLLQFQPDRVKPAAERRIRSRLRALSSPPQVMQSSIEEGDDRGRYVNVHLESRSRTAAWSLVRLLLNSHYCGRSLRQSTIVTCQGKRGWEDYLLLHHFDPGEPLDRL